MWLISDGLVGLSLCDVSFIFLLSLKKRGVVHIVGKEMSDDGSCSGNQSAQANL